MYKSRRFYSAILIFFCAFPVAAFSQVSDSVFFTCPNPTASMLWKIENQASSPSTVHLFGSIHIGKAEFYPLPEVIESALLEAEHLVFEIDPTSVQSPEIAMQMQARGRLPQGQSLRDILSADTVESLQKVAGEMGMPVEALMGMQPWFLILLLSNFQINALGYSPDYGIEAYFMGQKSNFTDVLALETIEDQLALLESLNSEAYLDYMLQSFEAEGIEEIERMIQAWQCADKPVLETMLFETEDTSTLSPEALDDLNDFQEKLFFERNVTMAAGVKSYLENGSDDYFVVVGSGHLLGEGSVIDLLRRDGYEINPVLLSP